AELSADRDLIIRVKIAQKHHGEHGDQKQTRDDYPAIEKLSFLSGFQSYPPPLIIVFLSVNDPKPHAGPAASFDSIKAHC
ncbi:MAG: hypothetical protein SPJ77_04610, partial [Eubacteriales bacterium]|nr:hypothetical protein [Eubacteriales bacterium]